MKKMNDLNKPNYAEYWSMCHFLMVDLFTGKRSVNKFIEGVWYNKIDQNYCLGYMGFRDASKQCTSKNQLKLKRRKLYLESE